jgi:hypothetical protein
MTRQEEQNDVLRDCAEKLERLGIAYMLTDSMALAHYAMPRTTADIDIMIEISMDDVDKFIGEFEPDYYIPHDRIRDAISRNRMFNILNQKTIIKVDCVVRKNEEFQKEEFSRRKRINYAGYFDVWIIGKEDLILSKLNWAKNTKSEMQMRDVASILRNGYDENYVQTWAEKLGVKDLLSKCLEMIEENYVEGYDS